jgi:8-oxo-dGTP pyrophosphatase MutT (NUDIX family)
MLTTIKKRLNYGPTQLNNAAWSDKKSIAAVLLLLHGDPADPYIILTRRANHLKSHAGEVAFPGGMKDSLDNNLLATALRETEEEIGIAASQISVLGRLPIDSPLMNYVRVTPFIGWVDLPFKVKPNPSEIDAVFNFPLNILLNIKNYHYFCLGEGNIQLPCVMYQDYKIWGFTLKVMVDMLNNLLDAKIKLRYPSWDEFNQSGY